MYITVNAHEAHQQKPMTEIINADLASPFMVMRVGEVNLFYRLGNEEEYRQTKAALMLLQETIEEALCDVEELANGRAYLD